MATLQQQIAAFRELSTSLAFDEPCISAHDADAEDALAEAAAC